MNPSETTIAIVGLGYVGLPLAIAFDKSPVKQVIGFDISQDKIKQLNDGIDPTHEVGDDTIKQSKIIYTDDPSKIVEAQYIIVAVPTPINQKKEPDLSIVKSATELVAQNMSDGATVIFESTVYPGVTEDICVPILEKSGKQFKVGYSPERVNPGDKDHTIDKVVKVVSGQDQESLDQIAQLYELVCQAGVHKAPTIKTAEAAKVIENVQRDLNIALVNELSLIFDKLDIDTQAVLDAAGTKWNFHKYHPGLVGGHCIGVDPYYLTYRAQQMGYQPEIILAGRSVNDAMAAKVADRVLSKLPEKARVAVLGLSFKENVNDYRNSKAADVINRLKEKGAEVVANDPLAEAGEIDQVFGVENTQLEQISDLDGIIYLVPHEAYEAITLDLLKAKCRSDKPVLFDLRRVFDRDQAEGAGFTYLTL